jgi:predicted transcriptional regulator
VIMITMPTAIVGSKTRHLTLVLISLLVVKLADLFTTNITFDSLTASHSLSMKERRTLRQPYRDRYKIARDILSLLPSSNSKSASLRRSVKTSIGDFACLSQGMTTNYFRLMVKQDLLRYSEGAGPYSTYEITERGLRYLQLFAEIEDDLRATSN